MEENKIPGLNQWDRLRLEESIKEIGVQLPVVFDQHGRIIDGFHRKEIAEKLGIDYPKQTIEVKDDEEFNRLSIDLNLARRHLTSEQLKNWYEERRKIALKARKEGKTQKEAAELAGVSRQAVAKWESELKDNQHDEVATNATHGNACNETNVNEKETKNAYTPPDNRVKIDKSLYEEIWQRRQNGETTTALADEYGTTHQQISNICAQVTKKKNREKAIQESNEKSKNVYNDNVQIIHGDMTDLDIQKLIEPESIDAIITDPPYPKEYLPLWDDLATLAKRVLKPSGLLVTYCGHIYLDIIMEKLSKELQYYWTFALIQPGAHNRLFARNIFVEWKPILIFQKAPFQLLTKWANDVVKSEQREKELHEWQQSESSAEELIKRLTVSNQIILDPFAGSGTNLLAAAKLGRKAIGIEKDEKYVKIIRERLGDQNGD